MFKKILIANRGEIAVRVIKTCREMGIISAVPYSDTDINSLHVRAADEAYCIGGKTAAESYLDSEKILKLAKEINADAIHPGYGFLSENSDFIKKLEENNIQFIGPSSESVLMMGDKTTARQIMGENKVPIVPGTDKAIDSMEEALKTANEIGYPIMLKASAGGGGKGMRRVNNDEEFVEGYERASNEALKFFNNGAVYMEKFIENPKHIEVQIIADKHGNYLHLFERECSVQRRQQKIIEEAPSSCLTENDRIVVTTAAIEAAKACNYYNAGTIEFLMDKDHKFYFLEMNTRLQVEHPVTEMITGVDLVKEQIYVAEGKELRYKQSDIQLKGHSIECRVYAESAENNFAPSIGKIIHHRMPSGPGIRVDRGIDLLTDISVYFDPMLSKVISWGEDRNTAIRRMLRALGEYQIAGVITNLQSCKWILQNEKFVDTSFTINFIDEEFIPLLPDKWKEDVPEHYENAAALLSALLKNKETQFKPEKIDCSKANKWKAGNDE